MISNNFNGLLLFIACITSGLYAGTGFFVAMGGNPAIKLMSDRTFAEYWQHTDRYMAARMKIFGPLLLLSLLVSVLALVTDYRSLSFWFILAAFLIVVIDIVFTLSTNHTLNNVVQRWQLNNLPPDVQDIKWQIVKAFNVRTVFMIASFVMTMLAAWAHRVA